jgi:hypothetical protein
MLKKTLSFGFVASSAILAVALSSGGCSSSDATPTDDGGPVVGKDSGKVDGGGGDTGPGSETCPGPAPTKADLEGSGGWKPPPPASATACTSADITKFEANFKDPALATYEDLLKGLPAACGACILGKEGGATWPFIVVDDTDPKLGFFNYGACYARAPNGSDACGKAVQYTEFCINASCSDCDETASADCQSSDVTQTACSTNFGADIQAGCGTDQAKVKALDDACGKATLAVGVLCGGGGATDAGGGG